jgi:DNA-binding IclR family transcriptional regulator
MAQPKAKNPIKAIRTGFEIVNILRELDGAGVTDVAKELDIPKSSVHNYLQTMEEEGYVVQQGTEYHVGLRFLELGAYARNREQVYNVAKPELRHLAEETGEWTNLMVEEQGQGIYLCKETGEEAVKFDVDTGYHVNLHTTALGKAIMAYLPQERVEEIIEWHGLSPSTANSITDRETLFEELDRIQERGIAFDREERLPGVCCAAAPILVQGDDNQVVGAISVSGPKSRMSGQRLEEEIPDMLNRAANVIGLNVSYS